MTLTDIVSSLYHDGLASLNSDFARAHPRHFGALASMGLITSLDANGVPSNFWRVTSTGLLHLELKG